MNAPHCYVYMYTVCPVTICRQCQLRGFEVKLLLLLESKSQFPGLPTRNTVATSSVRVLHAVCYLTTLDRILMNDVRLNLLQTLDGEHFSC